MEQAIPADNADPVIEDVVEVFGGPERPVCKKIKFIGVKPPKGNESVIERVACDDTGKDRDGGVSPGG